MEEKHRGQEGSVELTEVREGEKSGRALAEAHLENLVEAVGCVRLVDDGQEDGGVGWQGWLG